MVGVEGNEVDILYLSTEFYGFQDVGMNISKIRF
jgi:hypothetical protein